MVVMRSLLQVLCASVAVGFLGASRGGLELSRTYAKGEITHYEYVEAVKGRDNSRSGTEEYKWSMKGVRSLEVKAIDGDAVELEDVITAQSMEGSDPNDKLSEEEKEPQKFEVKTDRWHTKHVSRELETDDRSMIEQDDLDLEVIEKIQYADLYPVDEIFTQFPKAAVAPGETWKVKVEASKFRARAEQELTGTLVGAEKMDGVSCNVIRISGTIKVDPDYAELAKDMGDGGKGWIERNKATGTLKIEIKAYLRATDGSIQQVKVQHLMQLRPDGSSKTRYESDHTYELKRKN